MCDLENYRAFCQSHMNKHLRWQAWLGRYELDGNLIADFNFIDTGRPCSTSKQLKVMSSLGRISSFCSTRNTSNTRDPNTDKFYAGCEHDDCIFNPWSADRKMTCIFKLLIKQEEPKCETDIQELRMKMESLEWLMIQIIVIILEDCRVPLGKVATLIIPCRSF